MSIVPVVLLALGVRIWNVSEACRCAGQIHTHRGVAVGRQQRPGLRHQSKVVHQNVVLLVAVLQEEAVAQRVVAYHILHLRTPMHGKCKMYKLEYDTVTGKAVIPR